MWIVKQSLRYLLQYLHRSWYLRSCKDCQCFILENHWFLNIGTKSLGARVRRNQNFNKLWCQKLCVPLMECDYRWSPTPKPLVVSYLSESESEVGNLSSLSPLACRMATKVISVETSSLSGTHQSDKIDGSSLMALFSAWLSCFSLLLKQILVATQKIQLIFNIH